MYAEESTSTEFRIEPIGSYIEKDMIFASISGGIEIVGCFMLGSPIDLAVNVLDDRKAPVIGVQGDPACTAAAAGQLIIQQCAAWKANVFYPRSICPYCWSDRLSWRPGGRVLPAFRKSTEFRIDDQEK